MKNLTNTSLSLKLAGALLCSSAFALPVLPTYAQANDPAVVNTAQDLCTSQANAKGFELKEIIYAGAADVPNKDAKIVLNLLKAEQLFKLTCYYDKASGQASLGEEEVAESVTATTVTETAPPNIPWGWVLLPLLGLPLLLAWARNRDAKLGVVDNRDLQVYDALIRGNDGAPISVYDRPSYNSRIVGSVYNGDAVNITNHDTGDWIELASGGWIPKQYVATPARA